jgi:ABC-type antimicrobial peptide transport system permease subunit
MTRLSSLFGLLAPALACTGLYGLLSYGVSRRTRELGIRLALGARQREVVWPVVWRGIFLVLVCATVGATVAFGVTRYLASMLFEVPGERPGDHDGRGHSADAGGARRVLQPGAARHARRSPSRPETRITILPRIQ